MLKVTSDYRTDVTDLRSRWKSTTKKETVVLRIMMVIGFFVLTSSAAIAACEEYRYGSSDWWACMDIDIGGPGRSSLENPIGLIFPE